MLRICLQSSILVRNTGKSLIPSGACLSRNSSGIVKPFRYNTFQKCSFHTTSRKQVLPILGPLANLFLKAGAIVAGRFVRVKWRALPKDKKGWFMAYVKAHKAPIAIVGSGTIGLMSLSYYLHLQEAPITKRRRFIAVTPEQFEKIATYEAEQMVSMVENSVVPSSHPTYKIIEGILNRLTQGNLDVVMLRRIDWKVYIVDDPEINAMVLPTGHIFVYTGLLKEVQKEDQLAFVLAHEMAHAVLMHGAEQISRANLIAYFVIVFMAAVWAIMPNDGIAIVTHWFYNKVIDIMIKLPYSRKLETEADEVGLQLCSKACYDPRESSAWWTHIDTITDLNDCENDSIKVPEFVSTHPSHVNRSKALDLIIPDMLKLRELCKCERLTRTDPRIAEVQFREEMNNKIEVVRKKKEEEAQKEKEVQKEEEAQKEEDAAQKEGGA